LKTSQPAEIAASQPKRLYRRIVFADYRKAANIDGTADFAAERERLGLVIHVRFIQSLRKADPGRLVL
jgi:hypothetical protein